jgi:quercetin dioxygenase-like cupin family protein
MRRSTLAAIGGTAVGMAGVTAAAALALRQRRQWGPGELLHVSADRLPYTEVVEGASRAVLWGDPDRGAYAGFTRFAPGAKHPLHIHSHDITIVVVSGSYLYGSHEGDIRVGAGSYLFIPAGTPHRSGGDEREGCVFYEESNGAFDLRPLE